MPGAGLPPRETTKQDIQTDVLLWHARRDSNPQPSEPESDALSIEPLAHRFAYYSKIFSRCKPFARKIFGKRLQLPECLIAKLL